MDIDTDDVGEAFMFGGIFLGLIFLVIYLVWSKPTIKECEAKGGKIMKSNGDLICIDKSKLIELNKEKHK